MGEVVTIWLIRVTLWVFLGSMAYALLCVTRFALADFRMGLRDKAPKQCALALTLTLTIVFFLFMMLAMTFVAYGAIVMVGIMAVISLWFIHNRFSLY